MLLEKTKKTCQNLDFHCFSSKTMIFWWFFDNFLMIFESFASKEKIKKNLGNHQKIIVLLEKTKKTCQNRGFSLFLQAKRSCFDDFLMIFLWFPRFCLIFSFEAKPSKIIEKSSKNYHFFIIAFIILKKYHFFIILFVLSGHQPPSYENFFVSKSSWQTCWRWLSQGLNSARLPCTWTLGTWCQDI